MMISTQQAGQMVALSVDQAAKISSLSKPFLRLEIKNGNLPVKRPGNSRRVVIMMSDFMDYLNGENDETK